MINTKKVLQPPAKIGIIGGGQLGRMLAMAAKRMGYFVAVLDPDVNSPAGQVADKQIASSFSDLQAIRSLAELTDVLTYEFEHIDADVLSEIEVEGYVVYPSSSTLKNIQDKYRQKTLLSEAGLPVPKFCNVRRDGFYSVQSYFQKGHKYPENQDHPQQRRKHGDVYGYSKQAKNQTHYPQN